VPRNYSAATGEANHRDKVAIDCLADELRRGQHGDDADTLDLAAGIRLAVA
jgi:hypothetical protein